MFLSEASARMAAIDEMRCGGTPADTCGGYFCSWVAVVGARERSTLGSRSAAIKIIKIDVLNFTRYTGIVLYCTSRVSIADYF